MAAIYKIHPAIGLARVGNSPNEFYIAPEKEGSLPIACDLDGNPIVKNGIEQSVTQFKDSEGRIKRQAARFQVHVYDSENPEGREVAVGDQLQFVDKKTGRLIVGEVTDVQWQVYLANKKSSWYEFQQTNGEHGYEPTHPLRNANISDVQQRQKLIIDPGSRTVQYTTAKQRVAHFNRTEMGNIGSFPPALLPNSIDTLGEVRATLDNKHNRLLVLGGYGNSGSMSTAYGEPSTQDYANNDGWFDDISDGPITANILYNILSIDGHPPVKPTQGTTAVDVPAWIIVGYPRYAPGLVDIVTLNDLVFDLSVRQFAFDPLIFGLKPFAVASNSPKTPDDWQWWREYAEWNSNYRPYFYRDLWPLLSRPFNYQYVMDFDSTVGADPHETAPGSGGMFDPEIIGVAPYSGEDPVAREQRSKQRQFIYNVLRQPGQENLLTLANPDIPTTQYQAMPLMCGDNPLSNMSPSKFLRLTDTQLFLLKQWANGKFINEKQEGIVAPVYPRGAGAQLDQGVLAAGLGGAFCPGGEVSWIIRNPAIYRGPYRINQSANITTGSLSQPASLTAADTPALLSNGLEPGDLTKYSGVPWQADFNECSTQDIDITYENWNNLYLDSTGDPAPTQTWNTYWWPVHRPMYVTKDRAQVPWSPTPQSNAGDTQMVTEWSRLGFVVETDDGFTLVESNS